MAATFARMPLSSGRWAAGRLPSTLERRNHGDIAAHQLGQQLLIH
jgi:hypothetical protein